MRLNNAFREARGDRTLRDLVEIAATKGITAGTLSMLEAGRLLPADGWLEGIERAYGKPIEQLYSAVVLRAVQEDDNTAERRRERSRA